MENKILKAILEEEDKKVFQCLRNIIKEYDAKNNSNTKLNDLDHFKYLQEKLPPLNR